MTERGVGSVIVAGADGAPTGIVTDRDLRSGVVAGGRPGPPRWRASCPRRSSRSAPGAPRLRRPARDDAPGDPPPGGGRGRAARRRRVEPRHACSCRARTPWASRARSRPQARSTASAAGAARVRTVVRWLAAQRRGAPTSAASSPSSTTGSCGARWRWCWRPSRRRAHGRPPLPYSWLAAGQRRPARADAQDRPGQRPRLPGSARRSEAAAAAYFARLATAHGRSARAARASRPAAGGFMASNPRWCQPESVWRALLRAWMETPRPERCS